MALIQVPFLFQYLIVILQCNNKFMGLTKSDLFSDQQNELAIIAKVLGHPARIAIIEYLIKKNACVNSTLVNEIGLAQATISQHLKELKEIGMIQGTIEGASMSYCINPEKWIQIKDLFESLFTRLDSIVTDNCC